MIVAVARGVQVDWEWRLAVSLFQPDSQGSSPAATLTLARLMSPALWSMPGWVKVAGAASRRGGGGGGAEGDGGGEAAGGLEQTAAAHWVSGVLVGGGAARAAHGCASPVRGGIRKRSRGA